MMWERQQGFAQTLIKDKSTTSVSTQSLAHGMDRHENSWTGTAFLVEALLLLLLLLATLAVFVSLMSRALIQSKQQSTLDRAVVVATNTAEAFSAAPASFICEANQDGLDVACEVQATALDAGTLYEATITIRSDGEDVYELNCARYVSGGTVVGDAA